MTWIVKRLVPVPVGVPEILPAEGSRVRPLGMVPLVTVQVYGVVPPVAANDWE